jgi:hypothetical protein
MERFSHPLLTPQPPPPHTISAPSRLFACTFDPTSADPISRSVSPFAFHSHLIWQRYHYQNSNVFFTSPPALVWTFSSLTTYTHARWTDRQTDSRQKGAFVGLARYEILAVAVLGEENQMLIPPIHHTYLPTSPIFMPFFLP